MRVVNVEKFEMLWYLLQVKRQKKQSGVINDEVLEGEHIIIAICQITYPIICLSHYHNLLMSHDLHLCQATGMIMRTITTN